MNLSEWEKQFQENIRKIDLAKINRAGSLLPLVPQHTEWDRFLDAVQLEWSNFYSNLKRYPACFIVLFAGIAFFKYEDKTFWPHLASIAGKKDLNVVEQNHIKNVFSDIMDYFGLRFRRGKQTGHVHYVGSTVHFIGIPISLWDGFLDICEWASWENNWKTFSDPEWLEIVQKKAIGRKRLQNFLIEYRETAHDMIQEMLEARNTLTGNNALTISDIAQSSLLRSEYFNEVPETADFLRQNDPESLFKGEARLFFDEGRARIGLFLPAVPREQLPSEWRVKNKSEKACATPSEFLLNGEAFQSDLHLELHTGDANKIQPLSGLDSWGLFDAQNQIIVNPNRTNLPVNTPYFLVSKEPLEVQRKGFEETENQINDPFELEDGTSCFITRLWPTARSASLTISCRGDEKILHFRKKARIEVNFFIGEKSRAGNFQRIEDKIRIGQLPFFAVSFPLGFSKNPELDLQQKVQITVDDMPGNGAWNKKYEDDVKEVYFWQWSEERPVIKSIAKQTIKSFQALNAADFAPPDLKGNKLISIRSNELNINRSFLVEILTPKPTVDQAWANLPDKLLPLFMVCQSEVGMKADDLDLAKIAITGENSFYIYVLQQFVKYGIVKREGHRWKMGESRALLSEGRTPDTTADWELQYCGDPSILWGLYRNLNDLKPNNALPLVKVNKKRGFPPYATTSWNEKERNKIRRYLENHHVRIVPDLWRMST